MIDTEERRRRQRVRMRKFMATPKGAAWLVRNKEQRRVAKRSASAARKKRATFYVMIRKLKSGPCADCRDTFDPICMDFDHRPGEIKLFSITNGYRFSAAKLATEIAKCEVVCANCHRIRTRDRRRA